MPRLFLSDRPVLQFQFAVVSLPSTGSLSQLSSVYSKYGYEPKNGVKIVSTPTNVTGSNHRVYYSRPTPDFPSNHKWDSFDVVAIRNDGVPSSLGTITLVPPSGAIVGSDFLLNNEGWTIVGNRAPSTPATHEQYSRGALMNYYIMASDDLINVASSTSPDSSLWYFQAAAKFYGNIGVAYSGSLQFTIAAFSGDFKNLNARSVSPLNTMFLLESSPDQFLCVCIGECGRVGVRNLRWTRWQGYQIGI